jgi:hypothetical protein
MKKLILCVVMVALLICVRDVIAGSCCQEGGPKAISLEAVLEEARTTLSLTDAQLSTLKAILEKHGITVGARVCPMYGNVEKAGVTPGGCCAAKKEAKAEEKVSP